MKLPTVVPSGKLIAIASLIALVLGFLGGLKLCSWIHQSTELKAARTALAAELITRKQLEDRISTVQEASRDYQKELADLRAQPVPSAPVRLCNAPHRRVPETHPAESRPDDGASATGILQPPAGANPDIGPQLRALARVADEILAQARGLQRAH